MGLESQARSVANNPVERKKYRRRFYLVNFLILFLLCAAAAIAMAFMIILNGADVYLLIPIAVLLVGFLIQLMVFVRTRRILNRSA